MSIKADKWIEIMAKNQQMITPFNNKLIRAVDDKKIISYGLSSYGYDIRLANEFKVFTNANSALVDPKNFDESVFVNKTGDTCIIPPNSFLLGYSVEKIKTPSNVLIVCIGKSSYARCFSGDTRIALANGSSVALEEMANEPDKPYYGYGALQDGTIVMTELTKPRFVGRESLIEVLLDNGQTVRCTPDHEWLMRDGSYIQAQNLQKNDSIMPLYRYVCRGYEAVLHQNGKGFELTHRLADQWNMLNGLYGEGKITTNFHRHHIDENRLNNYPNNIVRVNSEDHLESHNHFRDLDPVAHGQVIKEAIARLKEDPVWMAKFSESQRKKSKEHFARDGARLAHSQAMKKTWDNEERKLEAAERMRHYMQQHIVEHSQKMKSAWQHDDSRRKRQAEIARRINIREDLTAERVISALGQAGSIRGAARLLECDRSVFRRFPEIMENFKVNRQKTDQFPNNHKVVGIKQCRGEHDVYCVASSATSNFALEAGVFVHNCGLIVNVTPMEPLWEGHITLEISNTTPLPAKVYANEGVAQLLFFESDEQCEITYADRNGKYQHQPAEVVLPRL